MKPWESSHRSFLSQARPRAPPTLHPQNWSRSLLWATRQPQAAPASSTWQILTVAMPRGEARVHARLATQQA